MQIEILKELVRNVVGKNADIIIDIFNQRDINEFKIAEKLGLTINQTRNILYKLFASEIVSFTRKKDKKKGWYIYYWTLNIPKALAKFILLKKKEISDIKHLILSYENKHFYYCPGCNIELNEENSLLHNFICPECGKLLQFEAHAKKLEELKAKIKHSDQQLKYAETEFNLLAEEGIKKFEASKIRHKKAKAKERKRLKKAEEKANKKSQKIIKKVKKGKPKKKKSNKKPKKKKSKR